MIPLWVFWAAQGGRWAATRPVAGARVPPHGAEGFGWRYGADGDCTAGRGRCHGLVHPAG
jgi:hypothetical protein